MSGCCAAEAKNRKERRLLWTVLIFNAVMFVVEFAAGWIANSSGLMADSLDMLADALVYAVGLFAVGKSLQHKAKAALFNGSLQLTLGVLILADVAKKMYFGVSPQTDIMTSISLLALAVNVLCFALLYQHRKGDINLRASWICSRNDMIANVGVLLAAFMVSWFGAAWPDWLIGTIIASLIIYSATNVIKDARQSIKTNEDVKSGCCG
ncbi:cation transporter [Catenovulum sediminis]|uniref:cation transporter n=1 Tax=Catenovulum sediminis TaxID=1740262 RepID=UPI00117CDE04|nr:cation diffusion facilitator family transporter [Catenovulum sediminis]